MRIHIPLAAALGVAFAAPAICQRPEILPAEYARAWGRGSSSLLGNNSTRTQMIFAQPFATGTPVFGVGFRPTASTSDRAAFTVDIEIQMSSTANVPGALSSTFANNVGSDMVVALPRQSVNVPAMPANRPTSQFARFPFAQPFVFGTNGNTNINVDVFLHGRSAGASWSTDRAFASSSGRATTAGIGCGTATVGSSSTRVTGNSYAGGETISITISGATPTNPALLIPSIDMSEFVPGVPLPLDLSVYGAGTGCEMLVNSFLGSLPTVTDGAGSARIDIPIPAAAGRFGTGWQWFYMVPPTASNPLGLETTANRAIWIGPEVVVPNAQYVWDLFDVNAASGTSTTDSTPIVEFMIP